MRRAGLSLSLFVAFSAVLWSSDRTGVIPRPDAADYPVHAAAKNATVGAVLLSPEQVKKMFPGEIAKKYAVVEVAIYPLDGRAVDIDALDFALKLASDERSHPRTPQEVASMWDEKKAPKPPSPVDVTAETGVVYTSGNDPVYGRSRGWGTYTGVGVGIPGQPDPPPPPPSYDPSAVEAHAKARALPEGRTLQPVAGYLYFPIPDRKRKSAPAGLEYLTNGTVLELSFPAKNPRR